MSRQSLSFSFSLAMQFYYYRLPDETKKIWPKTENYPQPAGPPTTTRRPKETIPSRNFRALKLFALFFLVVGSISTLLPLSLLILVSVSLEKS